MDVTIASDGLALEATLTLPSGDGPFPGVVIIHGSGPVNRDGTVPGQLNRGFPAPVSVYRDLAEGLAEQGVASLRYDKRTCGTFNGCAENAYPIPGDDLLAGRLPHRCAGSHRLVGGHVTTSPKSP